VRLAAVDLGTNSVHMVIADVGADGRIRVVDRVKEMVRLGRRAFTTGRLSPASMDLAVHALVTFRRLARVRGVERIATVATSAVREARNGPEFVQRLRRETGFKVRVISGPAEARLIFRAARHALGLHGGPHLVMDVGGGSVELVLVQDGRPLLMQSLPLGAARLAERFFPDGTVGNRQVRRLEAHLERTLGPLLTRLRHGGVQRVVGTSGTINTLVAMAVAARGDDVGRLHGARASAAEMTRLRRALLAADAGERAELPGMDVKRVDLMPAAAVLVEFLVARTGAAELVACGWALREGLLLELAERARGRHVVATTVRRRSVEALAERFSGANVHGRQVARLALALFDATATPLRLPGTARELLEYAALLHDIGHAIDHDRHHRHAAYLIRNAELLGFDQEEVAVIAHVARGHRKQAPREADPELRALSPPARRSVRALAALLRLADALDRTRFGVVRRIDAALTPGRLAVRLDVGADDAELELWAASRRVDLLSRLLDRPVELRVAAAAPAAARARTPRRAGARA
jgi:exopolyphosphatase/guanosine-5'-triphosphate,3'-diphosphate pyrophosphatase